MNFEMTAIVFWDGLYGIPNRILFGSDSISILFRYWLYSNLIPF